MSHEVDNPYTMLLKDLAEKCAQETVRYYHGKSNVPHGHNPKYCFELFRRAIEVHDEDAWHAIVAQYKSQVEKWVYGHVYFQYVNKQDDPEDLIAQALERFWKSYTVDKFAQSEELKGVLKYLKMCVNGVVTDAWRKLCRKKFEQHNEEEVQDLPDPSPTPENSLQTNELWQHIEAHYLKDQTKYEEYIVVYASFVLGLTPRQILSDYRGLFKDVNQIYQYKAKAKSHWENDPYIRGFL